MTDRRRRLGDLGERVAAAFLSRHGLRLVAHNVAVGGGELDILAMEGSTRVAVEVRSVTAPADPFLAFGPDKEAQVGRLGRMVGADRIDLVAVCLASDAAEVRWVRGVA